MKFQSQFSRYEIIGQGSFGDVYRGKYKATEQTVAIKVVDMDNSQDELEDILIEINILNQNQKSLYY